MCGTVRLSQPDGIIRRTEGVNQETARSAIHKADCTREDRNMTKSITRIVLTILMYAGVVVFLFPYFAGKITTGVLFMIIGAGFAVVCGLLRCYLTDGDCGRVPQHSRDW
jgi:hypothetical protein